MKKKINSIQSFHTIDYQKKKQNLKLTLKNVNRSLGLYCRCGKEGKDLLVEVGGTREEERDRRAY